MSRSSVSRSTWLSPAAAAGEAGVPVWVVHYWLRKGALHETRIDGMPRIRRQELDTLLAIYKPAVAA